MLPISLGAVLGIWAAILVWARSLAQLVSIVAGLALRKIGAASRGAMYRMKPRERRAGPHPIRTWSIAVALIVIASNAHGEQSWRPNAIYSQVGSSPATRAWTVGAQWYWDRSWRPCDSLVLRGRWEFALGRWRADTGDGAHDLWITQISVVPTLRLSNASQRAWYAEVGSGPTLLMPVFRNRDREFSTEFNFQSHVAVGYIFGARDERDLALRLEHFSNAGIREPNPGINFSSLRYTYRFGPTGTRSEGELDRGNATSFRMDDVQSLEDSEKALHDAQNPIANTISLPFQNNAYFNAGPLESTANVLVVQRVVPFKLTPEWNLVTRWVTPVIYFPPGFL